MIGSTQHERACTRGYRGRDGSSGTRHERIEGKENSAGGSEVLARRMVSTFLRFSYLLFENNQEEGLPMFSKVKDDRADKTVLATGMRTGRVKNFCKSSRCIAL